MKGINKVTLVGCLGQDPVIRHSGELVIANLSVATTEGYGEKIHTEWHKVTFFGKLAEVCANYLNKGSKVYIEGCIRAQKYKDKEGNDKISYGINGNNLVMLDSKDKSEPSPSNPWGVENPSSFSDDSEIPF